MRYLLVFTIAASSAGGCVKMIEYAITRDPITSIDAQLGFIMAVVTLIALRQKQD